MMLRMISVSLFLFGATVGWLIVYFVRKYKEHNPKGLRETIVLFLGGGCMELLLSLIDNQVALYAFIAYIIGFATAFFLHWIYQFIVAKITAPKFLDPRSKYELFSGCNLSDTEKDARSLVCYQLEIVNQGFQQLCEKLITEDEFITLVKKSGLTRQAFEDLTSHPMGDMFLSPALTAYIRAKNVFDTIEGDALANKKDNR
ncbi:hypothetical protein RJT11_03430 [Segatella copri]|uniref:hypothetical protein n=1 Tax=Segatella copri TaxID=165179 RepID=UPI00294A9E3A|nr:hypothetical protein [Segatella copri]WOG04590.1 hypothetical protein RJT11_03430 [Segatella copri]